MKKRDFNPFNRVQVDTPNTNMFDLSRDNKLTLSMGKIYPIMVDDVLPGDSFTITPEMLIRFAPMTFPIMHRIDATIHFFYVPNRIVWNNWPKFLADEKVAGMPYSPPYIQGTDDEPCPVAARSFLDYLGLPLTSNMKEKIDAMPILAYFRIINEYYQDQNNDSAYPVVRDTLKRLADLDGHLTAADWGTGDEYNFSILKRAWEHDYFTSVLPWAQKGDAVNIPLELQSIELNRARLTPSGLPADAGPMGIDYDSGLSDFVDDLGRPIVLTGDSNSAELTGTINQLRTAMALQKFLEKNARSGTRYNELIMAHFGVDVGDARINRPEYIGGLQNNVVISEVLQTSSTTDSAALGDYAGYGTAVAHGNSMNFYCPEHGYIIGLLSVKPKTAYMQGIPRKFSRRSFMDYYIPDFAHIGEQAVKNKELYYDNSDIYNDNTFGYIPRYSEYKYAPSEAHGDFRTTLKDFHLVRDFANRPGLNEDFIYVNDDKRIFAVTDPDQDSLYAHIWLDVKAKRKIPFFTNPGGI